MYRRPQCLLLVKNDQTAVSLPKFPTMMSTIRTLLCFLMLSTTALTLTAQSWDGNNEGKVLLINFGYGPQFPFSDMGARFGTFFSPELSLDYLTNDNWIIGLQGHFLFGGNVKDDPLLFLRLENGSIIGNDREPADIQLRMRGSYYGLRVGKLIGLSSTNDRSGLRLMAGLGLLQHRIRIQDDPFRSVPQLEGEYGKGYDRLTNGLAAHQFIGYQTIGKNTGINITLGLEFYEGFTRSRRSFDFATQSVDDANRLDFIVGFKAAFSLPYFLSNADEIYY